VYKKQVLIDGENFAGAIKRHGEVIAFVGKRLDPVKQRVDLVDQLLAAGVQRGVVERRITVDSVEPVLGEHGAERCRNGNPSLGVDLVGECGHKLVHLPSRTRPLRATSAACAARHAVPDDDAGERGEAAPCPVASEGARRRPLPDHPIPNGHSWDSMGLYGRQWAIPEKRGKRMEQSAHIPPQGKAVRG
jgi:hypothetical protein